MPFGLKNIGSTFQRAVQIGFGSQLHCNVEAYMDDIVVKTKICDTLIEDLRETFDKLNKMKLKLNPGKCVFWVPSGKLLGFLVSHRGIEVNPDKIQEIDVTPTMRLYLPRVEARLRGIIALKAYVTS